MKKAPDVFFFFGGGYLLWSHDITHDDHNNKYYNQPTNQRMLEKIQWSIW